MGRHEDYYEDEYAESEQTRCARPAASIAPSYDDYVDEQTRSPREAYAELSPFVAPPEIEGDRSPAIRARRASRPSFYPDVTSSAPEIEEVTSFVHRPAPPPRAHKATDKPLDYEALKRFLFEDGPDPGADDYEEQVESVRTLARGEPSRETALSPGASRSESPRSYARPPMMSSHPEFEGPRVRRSSSAPPPPPARGRMMSSHPEFDGPRSRAPMMSSHPDFEGPRGTSRAPMMSSHPDFEGPRGTSRAPMMSSHPDFEGPRGTSRAPMMSSHPDFEGPRGGRGRMMSSHPDFDGPRAARAPMLSAHPDFEGPRGRRPHSVPAPVMSDLSATYERLPVVGESLVRHHGVDLAARVPHDSVPSVDASWVVSTPYPMPPVPQRMALPPAGVKVTASFVAAAVTALAALTVMIGALLFVRGGGAPRLDPAAIPAAMETPAAVDATPIARPPAPFVPVAAPAAAPAAARVAAPAATGVVENANARADQTPTLPPSQRAAPPAPEPGAKTTAAKKTRKVAAKPVTDDDEDDEPVATPSKKVGAKKAAKLDKSVAQTLADLQDEQLRR